MESQTYSERQEDEVEFLQCVFMNDFEDLRNNDPWKIKRPPEIQLFLTPQRSMGTSISQKQRIQISVKLRAKYSNDYPDTPPELQLTEPHCLSEDLMKSLLKEINELAKEKVGEVMMLEIVQHIQVYLHKHDLPPVSLHEEMIKRKTKEAEEERRRIQRERLKMEEEQMQLEQELLQGKMVTSMDDSSGSDRDTSNVSLEAGSVIDHTHPAHKEQRKVNILRGKLLGISSGGGYSVYSGMECESGDTVVIYEWKIPCKTAATRTKRMKQIASIRQEFEHFLEKDSLHSNLVRYIEMRHEVNDMNILVEVVCESVRGANLKEILSNPNTGPLGGQTLQHYSRQLLETVHHLHVKGIVHNDLRPSLVFIDPIKGGLKLCGHTVIKRLSDLIGRNEEGVAWPPGLKDFRGGKKQDILKMGMIVLCMFMEDPNVPHPPSVPAHLPDSAQDFLNKCLEENEYKRYPSHDLMTHPFVIPSPLSARSIKTSLVNDPNAFTPGIITNGFDSSVFMSSEYVSSSPGDVRFCTSNRSRLGTDFDEMETLGKGGFGDVIKVKNRLDGRYYAIKKIKLAGGSKMMDKLTREVELLSQMNHENIVRYYNAWIESFPDTDCSSVGTDLVDYDSASDSASSSSEDESEEDEMDESVFIDFRSDSDVSQPEREPDSEQEEVFEFSSEISSGSLVIGTQQLEATVMDMSPRRLRRSETESSEGIVFQDSSSTATTTQPSSNQPHAIPEVDDDSMDRHNTAGRRRGPSETRYLYIQMEYCSNQTVRHLIDNGQLHKGHSNLGWQLFREIVEGLAHIHAQGMIHRDLKPGNVFLNSSGHIKIGDFGLAISCNKRSPAFSRQNSITANPSSFLAGDTGLVGTALYLAPELLNTKNILKYTPKVDIYSLGIIFFEMCHPPVSTLMERAKILSDIRKKDIKFPRTFDQDKKQTQVIQWLLNHNPQERPTSKELLQSPLVPYKIVDEELQEVFTRTLQNPNSSRYRRLIEELLSQKNPKLIEHMFFTDPKGQESKKSSDKVKSHSYIFGLLRNHLRFTATNVFSKHCALSIQTPLLGPSYSHLESSYTMRLMDSTGKIISLPTNHWVSFARYVFHQNITSLKRYDFTKMYILSKRQGTHPKEIDEYAFDIVMPSPANVMPTAEVITVALDILSDLSLLQHGMQFGLWLNHTSLTTAILNYCSISPEQHHTVLQLLHQISTGRAKLTDLDKTLTDKHNIQLSPLAHKTLLKLMDSEILLSEADSTLQSLTRCRSSVSTLAKQALSDIKRLMKQIGTDQLIKVCITPGMVLNPEYFEGILFQVVLQNDTRRKKKHSLLVAVGGQYDKLVDTFRRSSKVTRESFGGGRDTGPVHYTTPTSSVSVCGVSIREEPLLGAMCGLYNENQNVFQISNCRALVCWLGRESLQTERNELVKDLRERGIYTDTLYDNAMTLEEIQDYCRHRYIPHIIILERSAWMRQQVTVRTLESGRGMDRVATEKTIGVAELPEYVHQGVDKPDSGDINQTVGAGIKSTNTGSDTSSGGSLPSISITTVGRQKPQGTMRRRMDSQTLNKLLPLLKTYSPKYSVEIIVVDFELEPLCLFAAELNKALGRGRKDLSNVIRLLNESDNSLGKKYVAKVCESIQEKLAEKSSVIILYSHVIEQCQIIVNNLT